MRYHLISVLSIIATIHLGSLSKPLSPHWDDMRIKHSWNAVPENWESLGCPLDGTTIDLYVALWPYRENALIDELYEVSNPDHPRYGAYLSDEQVAELVAPRPGTFELVNSWLEYHGVSSSSVSMTHGGTTLTLNGVSVTQANALLGASYQLYRHVKTNETIVRTIGYALPAALHGLVQTVAPTTYFASPRTQWQPPRKRSGWAAAMPVSAELLRVLSTRDGKRSTTPSLLRWLYGTSSYTPVATDQNALGIVGILNDYPNPADLAAFMRTYRSDGADATFTVVQVNRGGYDPNHPTVEANLDTQYAEAMVYPTPVIFYSNSRGASGTTDWFISWFDYILEQTNIPRTISVSYSLNESTCPKEYAMYLCSMFAILGVRGVSVIFASGDDGVGPGDCKTDDGSVRFLPAFPATCPWVTSVGGTTGFFPEEGAIISGGGFSTYFERPEYQQQAVPTFLRHLGDTYQGLYNTLGRGFPDIAAQAMRFPIFLNGVEEYIDGTSGSAPIVAGIIALLNDYQVSRGKAPLGFLNPWLYGKGLKGIYDVTKGSNPGCNLGGFSATEGWDPVTGLGTLDFQNLQYILDVGSS
ncbi:subtilisin-like protein [Lactarius akahatsu]|uniref:tripeptidyl-peptidase II n=1 Tax=Lactarius akahatsu TaxID=416441 RepID=A0AAD4L8W6_9AGAM|nr:subtilisin-like protein [Lactarius akahatsu]